MSDNDLMDDSEIAVVSHVYRDLLEKGVAEPEAVALSMWILAGLAEFDPVAVLSAMDRCAELMRDKGDPLAKLPEKA